MAWLSLFHLRGPANRISEGIRERQTHGSNRTSGWIASVPQTLVISSPIPPGDDDSPAVALRLPCGHPPCTFPVGFPTDKKGKKFVLVKLIAPVHSSSSGRCSGLGLSRGGGGTRQCLVTSPTTDRVKGKVGLDRRGGNSNGRTHGALAQSRVFLGQGSTISDYSDATTHDRYHPNNDPAGFGSVPVVRHAHTHAHGLEGCSGLGMRGMALESRPDRKRGEFAFSVYDMHGCFCAANVVLRLPHSLFSSVVDPCELKSRLAGKYGTGFSGHHGE